MRPGLSPLHQGSAVAVKPAFFFAISRRLLLWGVLSVACSLAVSGAYFVVVSLSLSLAAKNLASIVVASVVVVGLSLLSCGRASANAGGNSFDRFRIGAKAERLLLSFVAAIALTFVQRLPYKLLPIAALAHVAYRTLFSTTCPSIQTVPSPLHVALLESSKRSLFDAGRLLATCLSGAILARILVEIVCSLITVASWTSSASLFARLCFGLKDALAMGALRTAIPFTFLSAICMRFTTSMLAYSLTYPIDFAKVFPTGSESALLEGLQGPNPRVDALIPRPDKENTWMKAYEAHLQTLREQLHTASKRESFDALPIVPSSSGNTMRCFLAQWVCSHAQSDLNRIVRYQRMRRQIFFSEEYWPQLLAAELGVIASATVQIEAILSYLQDTPLVEETASSSSSATAAAGLLPSSSTGISSRPTREAFAPSLDIYASSVASGMAKDRVSSSPSPPEGSLSTAHIPASPLRPLWRSLSACLGIPLRGDLAPHGPTGSAALPSPALPQPPMQSLPSRSALSPTLPSHALLLALFHPLFSQRLVLTLETLSRCLYHALSEDVRGVSVPCVTGVLCAFLRLEAVMLRYLQVLQPNTSVRGMKAGRTLGLRSQSASMRYASPEVAAVHKAVCEATWLTFHGYYDMLQEKDMPNELQAAFRAHRQVALTSWP